LKGSRPRTGESRELVVLNEVTNRVRQSLDVVAELTQPAVTVETQDTAHPARLVVVINVFGILAAADGALAALLLDHPLDICGGDSVSLEQVVVPIAAVPTLLVLASDAVVTRLAIAVPTVFRSAVTRELFKRLPLAAS
jgi:hypothetical protein